MPVLLVCNHARRSSLQRLERPVIFAVNHLRSVVDFAEYRVNTAIAASHVNDLAVEHVDGR